MKEAGLTRGAFYAHFESKDALVRDNLQIEAGLVKQLRAAAGTQEPRDSAIAALAAYLDPAKRADVVTGCPLAAHPVDAVRGDIARRDGYTGQLRSLIDALATVRGDVDDGSTLLAAVLTVGGGLLSGAVNDDALADRIEAVCLARVAELMEAPASR